ncbi:MAG: NfeD family protein [Sphingomonadaceae bacterium]
MDFGDLDPAWWWLIGALLLAILELFVPGVFLVWIAAAAALTGVVALTGVPITVQFALFALFSLLCVYFGKRVYDRNPVASADPFLNDRAARLVGETVLVIDPIEHGRGRVKVGDSVWPARGPDMATGVAARVVAVEQGCLVVEPSTALPEA